MDLILLALWGKQAACALAITSGIILLILGCVLFIGYVSHLETDKYIFPYKWPAAFVFAVFVLSSIYPSERLIFAYALAKGGEKVLELPEFEKARQILNIKLDEVLKNGQS